MTQVNTVTNDDELREKVIALQAKQLDLSPIILSTPEAEAETDEWLKLILADREKAVLDGQIALAERMAHSPGWLHRDASIVMFRNTHERLAELQNKRKAME